MTALPAPEPLVFVAHRMTGVRRIPARWLPGYEPSGFRAATPAEVATWYAARGLAAPAPAPAAGPPTEGPYLAG